MEAASSITNCYGIYNEDNTGRSKASMVTLATHRFILVVDKQEQVLYSNLLYA